MQSSADVIIEGFNAGIDVVHVSFNYKLGAHLENLVLNGWVNTGVGNRLDNQITGSWRENTLVGREGNDTLTGGRDDDTFVFDRELGPNNVDHITDFETIARDNDTLKFKASILGGGVTAGVLDAAAFVAGTAALDASDRFIFNRPTGELWFDADGSGTGMQILVATFEQNANVEADDILIF